MKTAILPRRIKKKSVDCAKFKQFLFEDPSTDKRLPIKTSMGEVKATVMQK